MNAPRFSISAGNLPCLLILLTGCAGSPQREGVTPTQAHMYAHFDRAAEVHSAVVRGDLRTAKRAADWLATHHERAQVTAGSEELSGKMQMFAGRVAAATDLMQAALAASRMGQACGECHTANRVDPRFLVGTAAPEGTGPQAEMARHVWASERMWQGMVGPLDRAWTNGAKELRKGWLDPQEVVSDPGDREKVRDLVRQVYEIGTRAEKASNPEERAQLYGQFLTTCIECHTLTGAIIR